MILSFRTESEVTAAIPQVGRHLRANKLLAYPTETVYGLGSAPTIPALSALARLKGRPEGKPFLLLISGRRMAEEWGLVFTPAATALSDAFWPGPLTLVLPGGEGRLPDELRGKEGGIAVRHTSHPGIARLITSLGEPLTSTSANRPGGPPAPGPDRLIELFGPKEELLRPGDNVQTALAEQHRVVEFLQLALHDRQLGLRADRSLTWRRSGRR